MPVCGRQAAPALHELLGLAHWVYIWDMNSRRAETLERQIATGETLLRRASRAKVTAFAIMILGILAMFGVASLPMAIVVIADLLLGGIVVIEIVSVYRTSLLIREIEDGLIEYRARKAGLLSQDSE